MSAQLLLSNECGENISFIDEIASFDISDICGSTWGFSNRYGFSENYGSRFSKSTLRNINEIVNAVEDTANSVQDLFYLTTNAYVTEYFPPTLTYRLNKGFE